jgi:omega-6 fatty acid desaturase (delta-12 desaturase)
MDITEANARRAQERELIAETRRFTREDVGKSVFYVASTFALLALALFAAARAPHFGLRCAASAIAGLLVVRAFILYHDHLHSALLPRSAIARALFRVYGVLVLAPPTVWKQTHDYHHAHTAKIVGSHVGSFAMLTTDMYRAASPRQRFAYRVVRHPLTIALGYVTIFLYGMCLAPLLRSPRKHADAGIALVVHAAIVLLLVLRCGVETALLVGIAPLAIACATGSYLFYAQHNFPSVHVQPRQSWSFSRAALESSSYMELGPVMRWFTGNIGYHHVHHLNAAIPFYRLPEAMAAIEGLQDPPRTTLSPRDVLACLRLKLWDSARGEMVGWPEESATPEPRPSRS